MPDSRQSYHLLAEDGARIPLPTGRFTLGSSSQADVQLLADGVDDLHLVFMVHPGRVWCQRSCPSGVFELNGEALPASLIAPGDELRIGQARLVLEGEARRDQHSTTEIIHPRERQSSLLQAFEFARASDGRGEASQLGAMYRLATLVGHVPEPAGLAQGLAEIVAEVTGVERACCIRFDESGEAKNSTTTVFTPSATVVKRVTEQGVSLLTIDVEHDPRLADSRSLVMSGAKAVICAPIRDGEKTIGALYGESRSGGQDLTSRDLTLLEGIASFAGVALGRAELYRSKEARELHVHLLVHDMKNPLGAICSALELLRLKGADEGVVGLIARAQRRLDGFVSDILQAAQLEDGALAIQLGDVELSPALAQIEERWQIAASLTSVGLAFDTSDVGRLRCDWRLVERVIDNLLDNALPHAPSDSMIRVDVRRTEAHGVQVTVQDRGSGVAAELRDHVFAKYGRATAPGVSGRGFGLYFCRLAIEAHGGSIWIEGEPGDNRVCFSLPQSP